MANKKRRLKILLFSFLHGLFMLVLTFYWLSLPYTFGDEAFLIKWTSLVKKELFGIDPKPAPEEILFVDVSANKTTIPATDLFGPSDYNRRVITDRQQISDLLEVMVPFRSDLRLVLLDILFQDSTVYDSLLNARLTALDDKVLGVSHLENGTELIRPIVHLPYALATYRASDDLFLKYPLEMQDSLETIPLVLLEKLNSYQHEKWAGLHWINGRLSFPAPLVDFKIRNSDFRIGSGMEESNYTVFDLGTIMKTRELMGEEGMREYFQDRIVLVGDFNTDVHRTPFDQMAGILLIYNAYLTLLDGGGSITIYWMLFLVIGFTLLSYRIFSELKVNKPQWLSKVFQSKMGNFIFNSLDEALLLTMLTIFSYFLFGIHINILILLVYIKSVEYVWKLMRKSGRQVAKDKDQTEVQDQVQTQSQK
ncbi:MAG: CHASE2 domain-containing protein [Saprospiraceae bacterium]